MFECVKEKHPPKVRLIIKKDLFVEVSYEIRDGRAGPLKVRIMGPTLCAGGLFLDAGDASDVAAAIPQAIRIAVEDVQRKGRTDTGGENADAEN